MKKKLLFVMNSLHVGGAEKALISMLQMIDYSMYEVDLQLFQHKGLFMNQIPAEVNILPEVEVFKFYDMPGNKAAVKLFTTGKWTTLQNRILAKKNVFSTDLKPAVKEQMLWKYISPSVPRSNVKYDAAISFLEKIPCYYIVDKVTASKKISYVQNDYEKLGMDPDFDEKYFSTVDYIATCSGECKDILDRVFPEKKDKIKVIENIVSPRLIHQMSLEETAEKFPKTLIVVSIGRVDTRKGYDLSLDAFKIINKAGIDFHWIILGEGRLRVPLWKEIEKEGMQEKVTFVGVKENHYPYLRIADIFLHTSRFEGKSLAIEEAKIMAKPILVTNFSTVKDQIEDEKTGLIAEMNAADIAMKLQTLLNQSNIRHKLSANLKAQKLGTEEEVLKLYHLIEN